MENFEENEQERGLCDVEETIFVAVGRNIEKSKTTLFWAVQNFAEKKICLLHVHKPIQVVAAFKERKYAVNRLKQHADKGFRELERERVSEVLDQYLLILGQAGVQGGTILIEKDNVENGIVDIIARQKIRWLVMGAAEDKYYSKKLVELKSKKAIFVCQQAPISCHIWFCCKGRLIYTRNSIEDRSEVEIADPFLMLNSDVGTMQSGHVKLESLTHRLGSPDAEEDADELETSCCSVQSSWSSNSLFGTSKSTPLLTDEEEKSQSRIEQAKVEAKNSKRIVYEEVVKRWKQEDNAVEAKCKVKAMQSLCVKEMSQRKELEELLAKEKKELERIKNQNDETVKELHMVHNQNSIMKGQITESHCVVKELEEKIISAVELLISFKQKRDELRIECGNAKRRVKELKRLGKREAASFSWPELLEFSFIELNQATNNLDPSWKIGEGRYGNVYRGLLRHLHVAIKMLPSYGSQSLLEFKHEVEVLSRVRHPNLVILIGTCPESRSLVYEYLRNGSLEDCLACKDKKTPLLWQKRLQIASEVCSALIYLHSNEPPIIHGNLKPSKVLLDANLVSKLGDFGIFHLIPQGETTSNSTALCNESKNNSSSVYMDPEYLETGKLTPEADVYSFGIILLRLLTGRPVLGIMKDVQCALQKGNFNALLDCSAGDWPRAEAEQLAHLALRCCEKNRLNRPDLVSDLWSVLEAMKASCESPVSQSGSKEHRRIPSHFVCPILQEVMKDPHIAADGFTYEGEAIRGWLKSGHNTSPMTNLKLEHCDLLPNYALHQAILEWQQQW
ncbi:U-box domain-containing protein kinase family protein [Melia azedarach]|uniref:U-box domain-containing protein kinase family protein n=1 Tax=Melia azedarach TaxID=155640 RepID=A0ACC1X4Z4_MELAZ|nr:U-box domain-containing protein kinase family protein [Melia azedarach]